MLPSWLNSEAVNINPAFRNRSELRAGVTGKQVLALPVSFSNYNRLTKDVAASQKQIHVAIQLEGRLTRTGGPSAFKIQDEMVLSLLCTFLTSTLERIMAKQDLSTDRKRNMAVLGTCRDLACIRNHRQLYSACRNELPSALGFERVGVLFTQPAGDLYIIN